MQEDLDSTSSHPYCAPCSFFFAPQSCVAKTSLWSLKFWNWPIKWGRQTLLLHDLPVVRNELWWFFSIWISLYILSVWVSVWKKTDGSKWTTLDANVWPPSQLHAATKNSKRTLISEVDNQHKFMFLLFLWSSHIMGRYRFEYHLMHCHFTTCRACSFQADPWWKITQ